MRVLVTGSCGFIGSHLCEKLMDLGHDVLGLDNLNNYYDVNFKQDNLREIQDHSLTSKGSFTFIFGDVLNTNAILDYAPDMICHLASLAGVRSSLERPMDYCRNNIESFIHLLEEYRQYNNNQDSSHRIIRMVYASSSSVYGLNNKVPFTETDTVELQNSSYACSKRCMEIYADYYQRLYNLDLIGLRFFTVYGPRGRPDMAPYKFLKAIHLGTTITKFGNGTSFRDYTYIDDIVNGIIGCLNSQSEYSYSIYNLGNNRPYTLNQFIELCEKVVGKPARIKQMEDQPGDVPGTYANIDRSIQDLSYQPDVQFEDGLRRMYEWMREHQRV